MTRLMRRGRAWAPAAKAGVLFILPIPLWLAAVVALVGGDLGLVALCGAALACLWGAGALALQGLAAEARYLLHERVDLPRVPRKLLSAVLTAIGAGLAALAGGQSPGAALLFAALGAGGHVAFYGADLRPRRIRIATVDGVDRTSVERLLEQAHGRLRALQAAADAIAQPDLRRRLARVTGTGAAILQEIERRPAEASRARRFLNVYLDGAERVTAQYARTAAQSRSAPLDQQFAALLTDIERTFDAQHRRLAERDQMALDVDIEVLTARLRQEALAEVEKPS